ncbi:MAG: hypothetical protein Q7T45_16275 [Bradyrhizobium sp.]|uniref:hypothetical protein n=1 Tax=Bradyrhizobium sp. TaxID=376 RepID=UPI00271E32DD|nr:hypothetical protein [Bradyrhizobium sp.]MDO8399369.1 hypothetical protein [Bradyrhizobium sp.]
MSEQPDHDGNPSCVPKRIDDDDDFSFLNNRVLDAPGEATNEEIIEALGEDDTAAMVGSHGATAAPEPTPRSKKHEGLLNLPPTDPHQAPADDDLDDLSFIIGEVPECELSQADRALLASLDDGSAEAAEPQPAPGLPYRQNPELPGPEPKDLAASIVEDADRRLTSDDLDNIASERDDNSRDQRSALPAGTDETPATAQASKAQAEPQPEPDLKALQQADLAAFVPDHPTGIDILTDDDVNAILALDDRYRKSAVVYVEPTTTSKFDGCPTVTDPDKLASLHKQAEMLRDYAAKRELRRKEQLAKWCNLLDQARARFDARKREAKELARRERDVVRKRKERASQATDRLTTALERATANHGGDRFLLKLVNRERELAKFREEVLSVALDQHGPKASLTEIATIWSVVAGTTKSKQQAGRLRDIVRKLEAKGAPWYRWRTS